MFELFQYNFITNALISGTILAVVTGVLSFFIVLKGMSYFSVGISHISFAGVSLGLLIGINPIIAALLFTVLASAGIASITKNKTISEDSAIGIFFSTSMALGIIFISLIKTYTVDPINYLFGDILGISKTDIYFIAILSSILLLAIYFIFKYLLLYIFDEEFARVNGIPVNFLHYFLMISMAVVIVLSIKAIGIVLISALLVIPANSAYLISKSYRKMLSLTIFFSLFSVYSGIYFSYSLDIPSGASIVVINALIFLVIYIYRNYLKSLQNDS
ncbi:MAG: metal ABC transporter permease [Candidatus Mcinerneyibacterium aminivorans]|uniref:Metal ABC transporter permease n=1 Tax=Candidatus Mcinerneyibacterium aminivorans TaxID=2703815 RepID=A0A5D0MC95_9BACT|nr:MAG: metal ABC transporter permease [Candidatus Mcinerneyibacterium aminivorans]